MCVEVFMYLIIVDFFSNVVIGAPSLIEDVSENESVENLNDNSSKDSSASNVSSEELEEEEEKEIVHRNQFFQDIFTNHFAPLKFQFGHACENPTEWEQRFEQRDFENNRHQGKVLWGDVNGNYGEHYWDLASGRR